MNPAFEKWYEERCLGLDPLLKQMAHSIAEDAWKEAQKDLLEIAQQIYVSFMKEHLIHSIGVKGGDVQIQKLKDAIDNAKGTTQCL